MIDTKGSFKLVGLRLPGKTSNRDNQSANDCGNLWQKFETDKIFDLIPNKLSSEIYAVYFEFEKDETTPFAYFIGCKVNSNSKVPTALDELIIPPQQYRKYQAKGEMTVCISDAWKSIWQSERNRKFGFDFEVYDERSRDWTNAEVDIFISLAGGSEQ